MSGSALDEVEQALSEIVGSPDEPNVMRAKPSLSPERIAWINAGCPDLDGE